MSIPLPDEQDDADDAVSGVVVEVVDGDRLVFQSPDGALLRVKLAGIDAPGLKQPYGLRARDYLVRICAKKKAWIVIETTGANKQVVGNVRCQAVPGEKPVDAAVEQLRRGVAWVEKENSDDVGLKALEAEARSRRRGLWTDPNPIAPWDWEGK